MNNFKNQLLDVSDDDSESDSDSGSNSSNDPWGNNGSSDDGDVLITTNSPKKKESVSVPAPIIGNDSGWGMRKSIKREKVVDKVKLEVESVKKTDVLLTASNERDEDTGKDIKNAMPPPFVTPSNFNSGYGSSSSSTKTKITSEALPPISMKKSALASLPNIGGATTSGTIDIAGTTIVPASSSSSSLSVPVSSAQWPSSVQSHRESIMRDVSEIEKKAVGGNGTLPVNNTPTSVLPSSQWPSSVQSHRDSILRDVSEIEQNKPPAIKAEGQQPSSTSSPVSPIAMTAAEPPTGTAASAAPLIGNTNSNSSSSSSSSTTTVIMAATLSSSPVSSFPSSTEAITTKEFPSSSSSSSSPPSSSAPSSNSLFGSSSPLPLNNATPVDSSGGNISGESERRGLSSKIGGAGSSATRSTRIQRRTKLFSSPNESSFSVKIPPAEGAAVTGSDRSHIGSTKLQFGTNEENMKGDFFRVGSAGSSTVSSPKTGGNINPQPAMSWKGSGLAAAAKSAIASGKLTVEDVPGDHSPTMEMKPVAPSGPVSSSSKISPSNSRELLFSSAAAAISGQNSPTVRSDIGFGLISGKVVGGAASVSSSVAGPTASMRQNIQNNGVSIKFLKRIQNHIRNAGEKEDITTKDVVEKYVKVWTKSQHFSLAQQCIPNDKIPHPHLGIIPAVELSTEANVYVSHVWSQPFNTLVDSLEIFCNESTVVGASDSKTSISSKRGFTFYFWLDICSYNQWQTFADKPGAINALRNLIARIKHTVLVAGSSWSDLPFFTRSWCLLEILFTKQASSATTVVPASNSSSSSGGSSSKSNDGKFVIQFSPNKNAEFKSRICGDYESCFKEITRQVDVESSQTSVQSEKALILDVFSQLRDSYHEANVVIGAAVRTALVQQADKHLSAMAATTTGAKKSSEVIITVQPTHASSSFSASYASSSAAVAPDPEYGGLGREGSGRGTLGGTAPVVDAGACGTCGLVLGIGGYSASHSANRSNDSIIHHSSAAERERERFAKECRIKLNLAGLRNEQSRFDAAEKLCLEVLRENQEYFGEADPSSLSILGNLAFLYKSQGHFEKAQEMYGTVLGQKLNALGELHPSTLVTMQNMSALQKDRGDLRGAAESYRTVLTLQEQCLGKAHEDTLLTTENLAGVYLELGRRAEAKELLKSVLSLKIAKLGERHEETLVALETIAAVNVGEGLFEEARSSFEHVVLLREGLYGKSHELTLNTCLRLVRCLDKMGEYQAAEAVYHRLIDASSASYGAVHSHTQDLKEALLEMYIRTTTISTPNGAGDLRKTDTFEEKSVRLCESLLRDRERMFGVNALPTLQAVTMSGDLSSKLKKHPEAVQYYRRVLVGRKTSSSASLDVQTLKVQYKLACSLVHVKQFTEAVQLFEEVLGEFDKQLGVSSLNSVTTAQSLATVYKLLGNYIRAEDLCLRLLEHYEGKKKKVRAAASPDSDVQDKLLLEAPAGEHGGGMTVDADDAASYDMIIKLLKDIHA